MNRSDAREPNAAPLRRVALLSTGEELISGAIADTNAPWIARTLKRLGALVVEARQVGDGRAAIAAAARERAARCDLLVVTGGLGPTAADRTREALADAAGVALREDAAARAQVEAYFARLGRTASASNRQQALLPAGARVVANPVGSAPGFTLEIGGALALALPGVPHEMKSMVEGSLVPLLRARNGALSAGAPPAGRRPRRVGRQRAHRFMVRRAGPPLVSVTVTAARVTICASDASDAAGRARLDECVAAMRAALGDHVFAEGDATLAETVVARLRETETVALAESCTGGLIRRGAHRRAGLVGGAARGQRPLFGAGENRSAGVTEAQLREHRAVRLI